MIRLIKAELKKLLHKKSFLIVTILFLMYAVLTNFIYKNMDEYVENLDTVAIEELVEENESLDLTKKEDLEIYLDNVTTIEIEKLKKEYKSNNQNYLIDTYLYDIIYALKEMEISPKNIDEKLALETEKEIYLEKIKEDNYKYFVEKKINTLKENLTHTSDAITKKRLEELMKLSEYRLNNNVSFDYENYLNNAIDEIETDLVEYYNLNNKEHLSKQEKNRLNDLKEAYLKNYYILENKIDVNNNETLQAVLCNFNNEFSLFFIIYIVMICGSIVSEEFNKGTIKSLLTKPFKRRTILTSKLLTVLFMIPVMMLFMVTVEIIMGGIILGFSSLETPVLVYNTTSGVLVSYSIFKYVALTLLANFPAYLVLGIICFSLSTITTSTSAAITITFLFYLASEVIANLALIYKIKIFNGFISLHWNFDYLVNLKENPYHFGVGTSLLVVGLYIGVILCITYLYFNKKDVKNI